MSNSELIGRIAAALIKAELHERVSGSESVMKHIADISFKM